MMQGFDRLMVLIVDPPKGFGFERDQNGLVTRLTGIRLDIHDRKSVEQEHLDTIHFFKSMDRINKAIRGTKGSGADDERCP